MFTMAIRGLPDFSYVHLREVKSFDDMWRLIKLGTIGGEIFFTYRKEKVYIYIDPTYHELGTLARYTWPDVPHMRGMSMSFKDGRVVSSGSTRKLGDWFRVEVHNHPSFAKRKPAIEREAARKRKEQQKREEVQSKKEAHLQKLVDKLGLDQAITLLSNV